MIHYFIFRVNRVTAANQIGGWVVTSFGKVLLSGAIAASTFATPAGAVVIERAIASNSLGYFVQDSGRASLNSTDATSDNQGQHFTFLDSAGRVEGRTEIGLEFTGYANEEDGGFFFLHNNFCVGMCAVASSTRVTFDIYNDGTDAVDLRFDSMITPGHLARLGAGGSGEAGFNFTVKQTTSTESGRLLYGASGMVNDSGLGVTTSDGKAFSGLTDVIRSDNWAVLDWGATNLNLGLGLLGVGERTTVVYEATYYAGTYQPCLDLTVCSGVQVVFGDPRANGSGGNFAMARASAASDGASYPPRDAINSDYGAFQPGFAIRMASDPLPGPPPAMPALTYDNGFTPSVDSVVPEPSTWLTMILGFAAIGGSLRTRQNRRRSLTAR
jgi:hypothetical protein